MRSPVTFETTSVQASLTGRAITTAPSPSCTKPLRCICNTASSPTGLSALAVATAGTKRLTSRISKATKRTLAFCQKNAHG